MIRVLVAGGQGRGLTPALLACVSLVACQMVPVRPALADDSGCSGFACLFSHDEAAKPPATPVQPAAADSAARSANAQALREGRADTEAQAGGSPKAMPVKANPARAAPVRPVVTIAAEPCEADRLKRLAIAMPRERIRLVRSDESADFVLTKTLGEPGHGIRLFTETLHIVAGPRIRTMKDLEGKMVAFAGTREAQTAARQAFEAAHVTVSETTLDVANAFDGLATGDLDAVVVLAPPPVAQLTVPGTSGLHLVSWPEGVALPSGATTVSIDAERYPRLVKSGESVRAMAVDAVLGLSDRGSKAPAARTFLIALSQRAAALAKQGFDVRKADAGHETDGRIASAVGR